MDADLKNHINKGLKTFEVFSKLKDFIDEIESINERTAEQRKYIAAAQGEIEKLLARQEEIKAKNAEFETAGNFIVESAKEEARLIKDEAKAKKAEVSKKCDAELAKMAVKAAEIQKEIDALNKLLIPLRSERDTIVSEIDAAKEKFRRML